MSRESGRRFASLSGWEIQRSENLLSLVLSIRDIPKESQIRPDLLPKSGPDSFRWDLAGSLRYDFS